MNDGPARDQRPESSYLCTAMPNTPLDMVTWRTRSLLLVRSCTAKITWVMGTVLGDWSWARDPWSKRRCRREPQTSRGCLAILQPSKRTRPILSSTDK
jgi:hypothetical protein